MPLDWMAAIGAKLPMTDRVTYVWFPPTPDVVN
jgi:hypothetical protein